MNICQSILVVMTIGLVLPVSALAIPKWEDIFYSSGPYVGWAKIKLSKMTPEQRAFYQESGRDEIAYCLQNMGKSAKEVDPAKRCTDPNGNINYYAIVNKFFNEYRDPVKATEYSYKFWIESPGTQIIESEAPMSTLYMFGNSLEALGTLGMAKQALLFYEKAYPRVIKQLSKTSDVKLLKTNFKAYEAKWPNEAEDYQLFINGWKKAKLAAKIKEDKPLDPAVQNHEWFYSDKQEEVLKALDYYHQQKVQFMLEKALKHKDSVVAAKAKDYLNKLGKDSGGKP